MRTRYTVAFSMLAGAAIGAAAIQGLHAQAKPPVYYIAEIEVSNPDAYKDYATKAQAVIKAAGGKVVAVGGVAGPAKITTYEGDPPKGRVVVQVWDSLAQIQAWRDSAAFKDVRKTGETIAKFRGFAVEGLPQ
jgi:uncharacterized protein (DUF1330 family)